MAGLVGNSEVSCAGNENDDYGRLVAVCHAEGYELNKALVAYGWVVAFRHYSQTYVADETRARAERQGIWRSTFELPEDFRHSKQLTRRGTGSSSARGSLAKAESRGSCVIKGNRSRRGEWIYHLPGLPYYGVTKAEELFCTEAQARAAGYRRAIVR